MTRHRIGDKWIDISFNEEDIDEIRLRTPERTGDLKRGWMLESMTGDIVNMVLYTPFVEFGTVKMAGSFMVFQSLWGMEKRLHSRIADQITEGAPLLKLPKIVIKI